METIGEKATILLSDSTVDRVAVVEAATGMGISKGPALSIANTAEKIGDISGEIEAELIEINPLAITADGNVISLDAKIIVDDNALFRHPDVASLRSLTSFEVASQKHGFNLVELDGNIAVMGNGAGLVLSTLDLLVDNAGRPACFLDVGGGATKDVVFAAIEVVSELDRARGTLLNIFGGITRTPDVAHAIKEAYSQGLIRGPFYARILGAEEEEANAILRDLPVCAYRDIEEAIPKLVKDVQRIQ